MKTTTDEMAPRLWRAGMVLIHRSGGAAILRNRKEDDSGWWIEGHGGLDDRTALGGDWIVLTRARAERLFDD